MLRRHQKDDAMIYDLWFLLFLGWVTTLLIVFLFGYSSGAAAEEEGK